MRSFLTTFLAVVLLLALLLAFRLLGLVSRDSYSLLLTLASLSITMLVPALDTPRT
jgi:hypothetical protein